MIRLNNKPKFDSKMSWNLVTIFGYKLSYKFNQIFDIKVEKISLKMCANITKKNVTKNSKI